MTVDGTNSCTNLSDTIIYKVLYIPGRAGFLPSTVSQVIPAYFVASGVNPTQLAYRILLLKHQTYQTHQWNMVFHHPGVTR